MNIQQGAQRMKVVGKWVAISLPGLGVLVAIVVSIPSLLNRSQNHGSVGLLDLVFLVFLAAPDLSLWLLGWIVEGFADRNQSGSTIQHE
jgi:hypothetical protein